MKGLKVILFVTLGALGGMVLGGAFGFAAGKIAPDLFAHLLLWEEELEPVGTAIVMGATGGVFCGAALTAFGIVAHLAWTALEDRKRMSAQG